MNTEPIRVLQVIGIVAGGGVESVVMNYYKHIDRSKVQFDFVVHDDNIVDITDTVESMGGKVYKVPSYSKNIFGLWLVGLPLLNMIKPNFVISDTVLWGASIMQFVIYYRNCYTSYFSCTNRIIYVKSFILSSAIGLVLSLVFMELFDLGILGLLGGIILSQLMYNSWYWPYKMHKEMEMSWIESIVKGIESALSKVKR